MARGGCRPEKIRICGKHLVLTACICIWIIAVNITSLPCNGDPMVNETNNYDNGSDSDGDGLGDGDPDPDDTSVCATNGKTYSAICHLLQNTANVNVLHAGRCNASQCKGGPVSFIILTSIY